MRSHEIKPTPTLTGKDAERFSAEIKANETKKISPEEHERMMQSYRRFKMIERDK
jgi:hypothetical protein